MSILSLNDPASLRRIASSLARGRGDYADIFLERTLETDVTHDAAGAGPAVIGLSEGCAARILRAGRVTHHAVGSLEPRDVASLEERLGGTGSLRPPAGGPRARSERADAAHDSAAVALYLASIENALRGRAGSERSFRAQAQAQSQEIAVATSEGEVSEDRRDWISFSAHLSGSGRTAATVSIGGGAQDLERLRALHSPDRVAEGLLRSLAEAKEAVPPLAGETTVVLAPGLGGILFHEACGHSLEGDRALRGGSALMELLGEQVGPRELTIVDDPTLAGLPGSRRMDDEGWPAARTVLVESGRVVGLLLDRATALLAGTSPTGSARRESYRDLPLPRMTNTFVLEGTREPEEILASVSRGIYISDLGSGEVDTATANFSFRVRRGHLVAGGRIVAPLAPCVIVGNGVDILAGVKMIGVDLKFDPGAGECGKDGQRARAGVGMPTMKVEGLSVKPPSSRVLAGS